MNITRDLLYVFIILFKLIHLSNGALLIARDDGDLKNRCKCQQKDTERTKDKSKFMIGSNDKPTFIRKINLYNKFGHYVSILPNGTVKATLDPNSPDGMYALII